VEQARPTPTTPHLNRWSGNLPFLEGNTRLNWGAYGMPKPVELILDTIDHHPYSKMWLNIAKEAAEKLGLELKILKEDYMFAIDHGVTDDLGMASLPQIMVKLDEGTIKPVLDQLPLGKNYKPDPEKAVEEIVKKIEELASS